MLVIVECDTDKVYNKTMKEDWGVPHREEKNQIAFENVYRAYEMMDGRVKVGFSEDDYISIGEVGTDTPGARIISVQ